MKKSELQKMLKPLIKECIKEVIFEDGVLSSVVSEVARGLGAQVIREHTNENPVPTQQDFSRNRDMELQRQSQEGLEESRRKLEESLGGGVYSGIFENTTPLSKGGVPNQGSSSESSPLSAYAPNDPGVDITGLVAAAGGQNWKKMI